LVSNFGNREIHFLFVLKFGCYITDTESLCAKVLKARYHKSTDFLQSTCPKRAAFTWRSIIHGRELLKDGLIWRIGDGESVKVWEDNWIPRSSL
jgi:hypothetical protein